MREPERFPADADQQVQEPGDMVTGALCFLWLVSFFNFWKLYPSLHIVLSFSILI